MANIELKSDFDGRSHYDLNDYSPGKFDGVIGSGAPSPDRGRSDDEDIGTCTDMGDCLEDEGDEEDGGASYFDQQPIYDEQTNSQDIRKFMSKQKQQRKGKGKGKGKGSSN